MTALEHLKESRQNLLRELMRSLDELETYLDQKFVKYVEMCDHLREREMDEILVQEMATKYVLAPVEDVEHEDPPLSPAEEHQVQLFIDSVDAMLDEDG